MDYKKEVIVVGGGIGGLATAYGLASLGKEVYVLEQASEFAEVGAGLQLGPNALRALDALGLLDKVYEHAVFPCRHVFMDALSGRALSALDFGEAFRERYDYPYIVMHRSDLHKVLLDACGASKYVTAVSNHKVRDICEYDEYVEITCENEERFRAGMVIGADGLWSTVRRLFSGDNPVNSQFVAYRGTVPMSEISIDVDWDEKYTWIGPDVHLVQYPVRQKKVINQVAVFRSTRNQSDSVDFGTADELDEKFSSCCSAIRDALQFINRDRHWKLFDRDPIANWVSKRIALIGDAAHPMLQYLAQGACQALEDAVCLTEKLRSYNDLARSLQEYQQERIPRTAQVQNGARIWGQIKHTADPAMTLLRNTIMTTRRSDDYSAVDWLYHYRTVAVPNLK